LGSSRRLSLLRAKSLSRRTNPKTVLWSADVLDDVDAMNLWTSVHEQEYEKSAAIRDEAGRAAAIVFHRTNLARVASNTTYETPAEVAGEFGADYFWTDAFWKTVRR